MIIRREWPEDSTAITRVHDAAFDAKSGAHSAESRLVVGLRTRGDADPRLSLVAIHDDVVIGHAMCSRGQLDGQPFLGLAPVGVLPSHQRQGAGKALIHAILGAADALDEEAVFVLGDPGYYGRFGFVLAQPLDLLPQAPAWAEHFQVRTLTAWDGSRRGTYRYSAAFDGL